MGARDFGRVSALPPLALLAQALPRLTRHELECVTALLIDHLDEVDGEDDLEPNGDEPRSWHRLELNQPGLSTGASANPNLL